MHTSTDTLTEFAPGCFGAPGPCALAVNRGLDLARTSSECARLWAGDATLWSRDEAMIARISNRTGWLTTPQRVLDALPQVKALVAQAKAEGFTRVRLLGMGGSSLCAEVLRRSAGIAPGALDVAVLDTTVPAAIREATDRPGERSLFLVASKSGSTVEVDALYRHFRATHPADRFIAITDPGTALETLAREDGFRAAFTNPGNIGGRFSALSLFGLVPAAFLGMDLDALVRSATEMQALCAAERDPATNPGLVLGRLMAEASRVGRDKLTLLLDEPFGSLGTWIEQLVAESTGKAAVGVLPVAGEARVAAAEYGDDRVFVHVGPTRPALLDELAAAGHPVMSFQCETAADLGGQFFLWFFATAVAGAALQINPFDEPNVSEAKALTAERLAFHAAHQRLPDEVARAADDGILAYSDADLTGRFRHPDEVVAAHLARLKAGDFAAVLAYLPDTPVVNAALQGLRGVLSQGGSVATTVGFGPRYLHSTGQFHKGGPNTGVFVLLTADDPLASPIPGREYDFTTLSQAQATGDFDALCRHGRRVLRLHLTSGVSAGLATVRKWFEGPLRSE